MEKPLLTEQELATLKKNNNDAKDMIFAGIKLFFEKYNLDLFNNYTEYANYFLEFIEINNIPLNDYIYEIYEPLLKIEEFSNICNYIKLLENPSELESKLVYVYDLNKEANTKAKNEEITKEYDESPITFDYNRDDENILIKDQSEFEEVKFEEETDSDSNDIATSFHITSKEYDNKNEEYVKKVQLYKYLYDSLTEKNEILHLTKNQYILEEIRKRIKKDYVKEQSEKIKKVNNIIIAFQNNDTDYIIKNYPAFRTEALAYTPKLWFNLITSQKFNYLNEIDQKKYEKAKNELNYYETYLIEHNYKLVLSVINKYYTLLEYDDLESAAIEGLRKAIYLFDFDRKLKFSTYAVKCIERNILRVYHNTASTIHIPVYSHILKYKIKKFINQYEIDNGHEPSYEEIAKEFGSTPDNVKYLINFQSDLTSLDKAIGDDEDSRLGDFITKEDEPEIEDDVVTRLGDYELLHAALDELEDQRMADILKDRFGINPEHESKTLEVVGKKYNLTRERIRQIEAKGLKKLRTKYHIIEIRRMREAQAKNEKINEKSGAVVPEVYEETKRPKMYTFSRPKTKDELRNEKK